MVWKVAGLLVIPKNITRGSNRPQLVWKAIFYLSLGLIQMLLKPQWTSSLVKYLALQSWNTSLDVRLANSKARIKPTASLLVFDKENSIEFSFDFLHYLYNYYMVCALPFHAYHVTNHVISCDVTL